MTRSSLAALASTALLAVGCGYSVGAGASRLPPGTGKVFVPSLENRTADAEAGALVAAALREELARRGASGGEGAPSRITGEVTRSSTSPVAAPRASNDRSTKRAVPSASIAKTVEQRVP